MQNFVVNKFCWNLKSLLLIYFPSSYVWHVTEVGARPYGSVCGPRPPAPAPPPPECCDTVYMIDLQGWSQWFQ